MNKIMLLPMLCGLSLTACVTHKNAPETVENQLTAGNPMAMELDVAPFAANDTTVLKPVPIEYSRKVDQDIYTSNYQQYPEVVRYGRYTLVGSSPAGGQKYLIEQLVQINMLGKKKNYTLTVEQGLWNTLKNTGFTLCSITSPEVRSLFSHQLPKVHYQFGPMRLREALQMLSGEAYELTVNDTLRQVCFERRTVVPKQVAPQPQIETYVEHSQ